MFYMERRVLEATTPLVHMHITLLIANSLPCPWYNSQLDQSVLVNALSSTVFSHHLSVVVPSACCKGSCLDPTAFRFFHLSYIALSHLTLNVLGCYNLAAAPKTHAADRRERKQDAIQPSAGARDHQQTTTYHRAILSPQMAFIS